MFRVVKSGKGAPVSSCPKSLEEEDDDDDDMCGAYACLMVLVYEYQEVGMLLLPDVGLTSINQDGGYDYTFQQRRFAEANPPLCRLAAVRFLTNCVLQMVR